MKSILIDIDKMEILKVVEGRNSVRQCEYWADILIPKSEFYICGELNRDLSHFTLMELQMLYNKAAGAQARFSVSDYSRAIEFVSTQISQFPIDDTPLSHLEKKLKKPLSTDNVLPAKEKKQSAKAMKDSGVPTRPKEGSMTARVWEAADYYLGTQPNRDADGKEFRNLIINCCVENGLNPSTASTQFAKWKKHHNLTCA
jgi:hypothetical protein